MNAKYIVVKTDEGQELLFTFPAAISHLWMLEAVENMKQGVPSDWERPYRNVECVGAGFITPDGVCFGGSQLLDMVARHKNDTTLLKNGHAA